MNGKRWLVPVLIGWLALSGRYPAQAYRALQNAPSPANSGPVRLVDQSSSLQDTPQLLNGSWDTTLTLRRESTQDTRPIQSLDLEIELLGSQGETLENVTTRLLVSGSWQPRERREIRFTRPYLGWPATALRVQVIRVNYAAGEPWELASTNPPSPLAVTTGEGSEEAASLSTDSPYIPPAVLSTGGSTGGNISRPVRPTRPRPVRPRPIAPPPPQATSQPTAPNNTGTSSGSFGTIRPLFGSPNTRSPQPSQQTPQPTPAPSADSDREE
ncbi:hypothetical protein [Anthocerotibacter panamensis]|uniref:hypothetical protein n=1 Tax=Anthocerotibacter panamensis TaxID=2857077 RepID=UPI001C4038B9|nr:hypothetical protein [Anthocerotibacter panamensis]